MIRNAGLTVLIVSLPGLRAMIHGYQSLEVAAIG